MAPKRCSKWPDPSQEEGLAQEEEEEEEEEDFALTQRSSQVQRNLQRLSGAQVDQKVSELVQFLLVKDQKKIPIKRADILKNIIKDYKDVYPEIINRAGRTLQQVFGLRLVEIDTKHHVYILVSDLVRLEGENLKQDHLTARLGLLTVILSFIYMRGNSAKECKACPRQCCPPCWWPSPLTDSLSALSADVWDMLKRLGVEPRKPHKLFGDVKKLVTVEFVQQKYLEYNRLPSTDPAEFELQWGPRAAKETSRMQILQFVAKIQSKDPKTWSAQYSEAAAEVLSCSSSPPGDVGGDSQGPRRRKPSVSSSSPHGAL
nr:non-structural maintenance of chromosomes element 3 homolog isoform X2 [Pelodiscus sinensis]|eukprot:XP_014429063.1 non-structural maintenance of chromosomes element 3 homolog isoform X2 [Pelodiscus sinensis]